MAGTLLTVDEVAARLKCHPHTVRRWIWSQKLRAVHVGDLVRVPEEEVEKLMQPSDGGPTGRPIGRRKEHRGAGALLATMRTLRRSADREGVALLERRIAEAEQSVDWTDPLA